MQLTTKETYVADTSSLFRAIYLQRTSPVATRAADIFDRTGHYGFTDARNVPVSLAEANCVRPAMRYSRARLLTCLSNHGREENVKNLPGKTGRPEVNH